jgi:hypothetical protein
VLQGADCQIKRLVHVQVVGFERVDGLEAQLRVVLSVQFDGSAGQFGPVLPIVGPKPDGVSVRRIALYVEGAFDDEERHYSCSYLLFVASLQLID